MRTLWARFEKKWILEYIFCSKSGKRSLVIFLLGIVAAAASPYFSGFDVSLEQYIPLALIPTTGLALLFVVCVLCYYISLVKSGLLQDNTYRFDEQWVSWVNETGKDQKFRYRRYDSVQATKHLMIYGFVIPARTMIYLVIPKTAFHGEVEIQQCEAWLEKMRNISP